MYSLEYFLKPAAVFLTMKLGSLSKPSSEGKAVETQWRLSRPPDRWLQSPILHTLDQPRARSVKTRQPLLLGLESSSSEALQVSASTRKYQRKGLPVGESRVNLTGL